MRLIEFLLHKTPKAKTTFLDRVKLQYDILGYVSLKNDAVNNGVFVVMSIVGNKRKGFRFILLKTVKSSNVTHGNLQFSSSKKETSLRCVHLSGIISEYQKILMGKRFMLKLTRKNIG